MSFENPEMSCGVGAYLAAIRTVDSLFSLALGPYLDGSVESWSCRGNTA